MHQPQLPTARGPLSAALTHVLQSDPPPTLLPTGEVSVADPYGEDLTLALHICYELHYRGYASVSPRWEWEPDLLRLRAALERRFLTALHDDVAGGDDVGAAVDELLVERVPGEGVSHFLRDRGERWQVREFVAHRSIYHLKEADPQTWAIPRLQGRAKAALVAVQFDEYGGGRADRVHAALFADLMRDLDLCDGYLHYLDVVPAPALAVVNLMSLFGLHRDLRAAMVGQFASVEITSSPSAQRLAQTLERLGAGPQATAYFTEHVEADAVHEQLMRRDVIGGLLEGEPELAADVVFGIQATELLEARLARHLLDAWQRGTTSLRAPLLPGRLLPGRRDDDQVAVAP